MEQNVEKDDKIQINIDNTDSALGWLEKILGLLKEYGPWKIFGATFMIAIVSIMLYFTFNITQLFEVYDRWKKIQHDERMEFRMDMGPKIQSLIDKLTYAVDASRTLVLELHNGNTGIGGLPFAKCTATYESLNLGMHPISSQYQDVNLSLIPFAHKLFDEGYWCGDTNELESIDRGLYYKMKSNGTEHLAACLIEGVDNNPIAFMIISYDNEKDLIEHHDCVTTRTNIRHIAMELAVILEVSRLTKK